MGSRGRGLAGRFRRAVDDESARKQRELDSERERVLRAAEARNSLFDDLVGFARETGFLRASIRDGALTLVHGTRELRFLPVGEGSEVDVRWEGMDPEESHRLYLEERLGAAWVWGRKRRMRPREERELLWDAGLEALLVVGLGLPKPDEVPPDDDPPSGSRSL